MKRKYLISMIFLMVLGIISCENDEWSFPDFDYTTTYFASQTPVRTLVLGDYYLDNSNDNQLKFVISANMGGVYKNNEEIKVQFAVDNTLTTKLNTTYSSSLGTPVIPLPISYYTLSNNNEIIIPSGKFYGGVEVQLTQAFLDDPLAIGVNYVIPLRILSSTTDSVLQGFPLKANPDPRVASNWSIMPKNYTLYGIRFINEYHGRYLMRGSSVVRVAATGTLVGNNVYRKKYVESDEVVIVKTSAKGKVIYGNSVRLSTGSPGRFEMEITVGSDGNCTLTNTPASAYAVTGTGKYVKGVEEWGGNKHQALYLNYQITQGVNSHQVNDTLVFRDKNVKFEEFSMVVLP